MPTCMTFVLNTPAAQKPTPSKDSTRTKQHSGGPQSVSNLGFRSPNVPIGEDDARGNAETPTPLISVIRFNLERLLRLLAVGLHIDIKQLASPRKKGIRVVNAAVSPAHDIKYKGRNDLPLCLLHRREPEGETEVYRQTDDPMPLFDSRILWDADEQQRLRAMRVRCERGKDGVLARLVDILRSAYTQGIWVLFTNKGGPAKHGAELGARMPAS
ncbi:hypothetical protein CONPUDRAFT_70699 [Coniophora puteana RWD-64-598 SS2]|uniref:Uncharacterized protein n=1 Tax=Coniophora puteana (strain RWD-64-598) TaxID=741705 RepID=A0A5M3MYS0_CONPW|nr:uncharacterized protein CONPUDRAFT_70699 [Coniophora puteana RWD-64-598 SS2]EIW83741.1 hypothetical protein CONPUDRAFT_70699 [Coniophora puteana RWD-64-598 SS2]